MSPFSDINAQLQRGMQFLQSGRYLEAERTFRTALQRDANSVHALFALGMANYQLRRLIEAEQFLRRAISLQPGYFPAYNNLALVLKAAGKPAEAIRTLRQVLDLQPTYAEAAYNLALLLEETGDSTAAIAAYHRVLALKADFLPAHSNLGNLLRARGDFENAYLHYHTVAQRQPDDTSAQLNLLLIQTDLGQYNAAIATGQRLVKQTPGDYLAWEALGNAQRLGGLAGHAVVSLTRAQVLRPHAPELQYDLGLAQIADGDLDSGRKTLDAVALARPDWIKVWFERDLALPPLYCSDAQIAECRAGWISGLEKIEERLLASNNWSVHEALEAVSSYAPFYLNYQDIDNTVLQRRFGRIVETVARRAFPQFAEPVSWQPHAHGGKLRVGFVSAYLRQHSIGYFFGAWITQLDKEKFESFVWHSGEISDSLTEKIKASANHYYRASADTLTLAAAIHAAQLDVLIHLDVGMHPLQQVLAALRLAPIQCAAYGHPVTTGIDSIDYYLSAAAAEPDNAQQHYTEKLIRLPRMAVSYPLPDISRRITPPALQTVRRPYLLCPQRLFKILPHFDRLAARIARELPGCTLAFYQSMSPRMNEAFTARIGTALRGAGVDPDKTLAMLPVMPYEQFLGAVSTVDLVLDTTFFSGGNSSFDILATGTPMIAYEGPMMRGRQTSAMLDILDVPDCIARNDDEYVQATIRLASNALSLENTRGRIHAGGANLFEDVATVRSLEDALLKLKNETPVSQKLN